MNVDDSRLLRYLAATVEGLRDDVNGIRDRMATKDDLAALESRMATKEDVAAIRGDIEQVQIRIDGVDRTLTTRMDVMDNRISRLRSAVYILAKEDAAVLRVLGD